MSDYSVKIENLSKYYTLGAKKENYKTLATSLTNFVMSPYKNFKEIRSLASQNQNPDNIHWALKNVDLEIKHGEAIGIIGKNGAGKSTLLKILSRITEPSSGQIKVRGRLSSLLEVGTGFNPELTGRENIFLNGTMLGMTKNEIRSKFDEIVAFSGVEKFIDTPVKRYSSGMYVRLAFAVAAHLEPDILVVDEVLAVGDAAFQEKCLGKMNDFSKDGRTVIFVSHNMGAVLNLCKQGVLLKNGICGPKEKIDKIVDDYLSIPTEGNHKYVSSSKNDLQLNEIEILNYEFTKSIKFNESVLIKINITNSQKLKNLSVGVAVLNNWGSKIFTTVTKISDKQNLELNLEIPSNLLLPKNYSMDVALFFQGGVTIEYLNSILSFSILDNGTEYSIYGDANVGDIHVNCIWNEKN